VIGLFALAAAAASSPGPAAACGAIASAAVPGVRIVKATAERGFRPPDARAAGVTVPFCRVEGVIGKEIGFELWLPAAGSWNGHMLTGGVGGQAGTVNYRELSRGVSRGYASTSTDTGHKASDPHWLLGDPMRAVNYAERANHLLAIKAKALIAACYGRGISRALFVGCSGGGRQAMTEAERYPGDYDGIIAGAPGVNTPEMSARRMWEMVQHSRAGALMSVADWAMVARAGVAACDAADGLRDGVVADPSRCRFDVRTLLCKAGRTTNCLNGEQLALVRRIYAPLVDENGRRIDGGLLPGTPVSPVALPEPFTPGTPYLAVALFGDGVHRDPHWDARAFRIADDLPAIDKVMNLHADDPDLDRFRARGGRLIMYQGWTDPLVAPMSTVHYYQAVRQRIGAAEAASFSRLYMVPGMDHCVGGAGADLFGGAGGNGISLDPRHDMLSALEQWLDGGAAPGQLIAAKRKDGVPVETRPLCPFPQVPRYSGKGDPVKASSFRCG
jgi:feruloyl esterase